MRSVSDDQSSAFPADGIAREPQHSRHHLRPEKQAARLHSVVAQDENSQDRVKRSGRLDARRRTAGVHSLQDRLAANSS